MPLRFFNGRLRLFRRYSSASRVENANCRYSKVYTFAAIPISKLFSRSFRLSLLFTPDALSSRLALSFRISFSQQLLLRLRETRHVTMEQRDIRRNLTRLNISRLYVQDVVNCVCVCVNVNLWLIYIQRARAIKFSCNRKTELQNDELLSTDVTHEEVA